jgi:hypothetical protein
LNIKLNIINIGGGLLEQYSQVRYFKAKILQGNSSEAINETVAQNIFIPFFNNKDQYII